MYANLESADAVSDDLGHEIQATQLGILGLLRDF